MWSYLQSTWTALTVPTFRDYPTFTFCDFHGNAYFENVDASPCMLAAKLGDHVFVSAWYGKMGYLPCHILDNAASLSDARWFYILGARCSRRTKLEKYAICGDCNENRFLQVLSEVSRLDEFKSGFVQEFLVEKFVGIYTLELQHHLPSPMVDIVMTFKPNCWEVCAYTHLLSLD